MWPLRLGEKFHCSQVLAMRAFKIDVSICPSMCLSIYPSVFVFA